MIYGTIATVDLLLMLRYSRKELPPPAPRLLLAYQAWTYYVFRRRVSRSEFQPVPEPSTPPDGDRPTATPEATSPPSRRGT